MTAVLELRNIAKRFGGLAAVTGVSFSLNENEMLFVIGPNGAGKTTVFNLISGFLHPDEGAILFQGKDISKMAPHQTARLGIGRTFQIVKPLPGLTVRQNVMLGAFMHTRSVHRAEEEAGKILDLLQISPLSSSPAPQPPLPP